MTDSILPSTATVEDDDAKIQHEEPSLALTATEVAELLASAKRKIDSSRLNSKSAAEDIAAVYNYGGISMRDIAKEVGKCVGWVNRQLKWREEGYPDETPFGAQSKLSRQRKKRVQATERKALIAAAEAPRIINERADVFPQVADGGNIIGDDSGSSDGEITQREDDTVLKGPDSTASSLPAAVRRERLVEALEMLPSARPGIRAKMALLVERRRGELGLPWNALIRPVKELEAAVQTSDPEGAV